MTSLSPDPSSGSSPTPLDALIVVPAHFGSGRLPGKPLLTKGCNGCVFSKTGDQSRPSRSTRPANTLWEIDTPADLVLPEEAIARLGDLFPA